MPKYPYPYPFHDFHGSNDRCELAEGVAFNSRLADLSDTQKTAVCALIHEYLEWMSGPITFND